MKKYQSSPAPSGMGTPAAPGTVPLASGIENALKGTPLESPKENFVRHPGPDLSKIPEANVHPRSPLAGIPGIPNAVQKSLAGPSVAETQRAARQMGELPRRAVNAAVGAAGSALHAMERPAPRKELLGPQRDPLAPLPMGQKKRYSTGDKPDPAVKKYQGGAYGGQMPRQPYAAKDAGSTPTNYMGTGMGAGQIAQGNANYANVRASGGAGAGSGFSAPPAPAPDHSAMHATNQAVRQANESATNEWRENTIARNRPPAAPVSAPNDAAPRAAAPPKAPSAAPETGTPQPDDRDFDAGTAKGRSKEGGREIEGKRFRNVPGAFPPLPGVNSPMSGKQPAGAAQKPVRLARFQQPAPNAERPKPPQLQQPLPAKGRDAFGGPPVPAQEPPAGPGDQEKPVAGIGERASNLSEKVSREGVLPVLGKALVGGLNLDESRQQGEAAAPAPVPKAAPPTPRPYVDPRGRRYTRAEQQARLATQKREPTGGAYQPNPALAAALEAHQGHRSQQVAAANRPAPAAPVQRETPAQHLAYLRGLAKAPLSAHERATGAEMNRITHPGIGRGEEFQAARNVDERRALAARPEPASPTQLAAPAKPPTRPPATTPAIREANRRVAPGREPVPAFTPPPAPNVGRIPMTSAPQRHPSPAQPGGGGRGGATGAALLAALRRRAAGRKRGGVA